MMNKHARPGSDEPQSETRMAAQSNLTDSALHDLRNLLASIRANADFIHATLEPSTDPEVFGALTDIIASGERIGILCESVLSKKQEPNSRAPVPFTALVERIARDADALAAQHGVTVCVNKGEEATVMLDRSLVARMLRTLVEKAVKSSPRGSKVDVSCGVHGRLVVVSVATADDGLFQESSRNRSDGESWFDADTQVDIATDELAFCRGAARAHDGTLRIQARREGGTLAVVSFPLHRSE